MKQRDPRCVFVVHGRNDAARRAIFDFLRSIGLRPLEWSHAVATSDKGAPFIGEILDSVYARVQAVVVLLSGDDIAKLSPALQADEDPEAETTLTPQPRPNVLFEAGLAFGRYPEHTILVQLGDIRPISDIAGRHVVRINDTLRARQDLATRLRIVGCPVDLDGTDWHTSGYFDDAVIDPPDDDEPEDDTSDRGGGGFRKRPEW